MPPATALLTHRVGPRAILARGPVRASASDAFSRRVVGWTIDASPTAALVTNALGMAIDSGRPAGTVIHRPGRAVHVMAFTRRAKESGLLPSMGSVGDCYDCGHPRVAAAAA